MSAKVGVQKMHFCVMETEDTPSSAAVYGTMNNALVGKLVSIEVNTDTEETSIYADNAKFDSSVNMTDITVAIDVAELPLEVQAVLLGHSISNGVMEAKADDVAPYVGLAFEFTKANGKKRFVKLYKGKFKEVSETGQTKGENTEFQTQSLEATFLPVQNGDRLWKKVADEEAPDYSDTTGSSWYTSM